MKNRIALAILTLTVTVLLFLMVYESSKAAGFSFVSPIKLNATDLVQTSDPRSSEPLILTDEQDKYPLGLHMEILADSSRKLTIADVSSPEFDARFTPSQVPVPNYGFTDSAYWVRLRLDNETRQVDQSGKMFLIVRNEYGIFIQSDAGNLRPV